MTNQSRSEERERDSVVVVIDWICTQSISVVSLSLTVAATKVNSTTLRFQPSNTHLLGVVDSFIDENKKKKSVTSFITRGIILYSLNTMII